jgi:TolA-binding protein
MNYSGSEEEKDRVQFLLAETYFVDLGDVQKAVAEYQKVYTNFPESQWAPKALYAQFWITKNVLHNDSLSAALATTLIAKYPDTGYTESARTILKHK